MLSKLAALIEIDGDVVAERALEVELLERHGGLVRAGVGHCGLAEALALAELVRGGGQLALLHCAKLAAHPSELFFRHLVK